MDFIMEYFRDLLYFMAGFFTTFSLGYLINKDSQEEEEE